MMSLMRILSYSLNIVFCTFEFHVHGQMSVLIYKILSKVIRNGKAFLIVLTNFRCQKIDLLTFAGSGSRWSL